MGGDAVSPQAHTHTHIVTHAHTHTLVCSFGINICTCRVFAHIVCTRMHALYASWAIFSTTHNNKLFVHACRHACPRARAHTAYISIHVNAACRAANGDGLHHCTQSSHARLPSARRERSPVINMSYCRGRSAESAAWPLDTQTNAQHSHTENVIRIAIVSTSQRAARACTKTDTNMRTSRSPASSRH